MLGLGQLPPVVDAQDFSGVTNEHRVHLALDQRDDVRQVILLGFVLVLELLQRRPQVPPRKAIDARVDLADLPVGV